MNRRPDPCRRVADALVLRDDPSIPLPPDLGVHVSTCERCASRVATAAALGLATRRARAALETSGRLSPNAWARIRGGIDEAAAARPASAFGPVRGWAGLLALAGVAVVTFHLLPATGEAPLTAVAHDPPPAVEAPEAPLTDVTSPRPAEVPVVAATTRLEAPAPVPGAGDALGGPVDERYDAFGRHRLTVAAGARVDVVAWDDDGVILALGAGRITADVHRDSPEEVFEIRVGAARVRVLGTVFSVTHLAGGRAAVSVEHGLVGVVDADGADHRVEAGASLTFATAATPAAAPPSRDERPARRASRAALAEAGQPEAARAPAAPPQPVVEHVVEIVVPAQAMPAPAAEPGHASSVAVRERLVPVVGRIRAGDCAGALSQLKDVAKAAGGRRTPPDILYLMGFCHRRLGNGPVADAFFDRYRRVAPGGAWPLPTSPDEVLPLPTAERLRP